MNVFTQGNYKGFCDQLAQKEKCVHKILNTYGYPPVWEKEKGFEGLVRIILEQQVSLASAFAVYKKLKKNIQTITPENIIDMTEADFKLCGFSRQKTAYVNNLAYEILEKGLNLDQLSNESDEIVRAELIKIKGIGNWTCDIYLLMCLNWLDIFPTGDLALINSMKENGIISRKSSKEMILKVTKRFKPYRSIFAMILWHAYIQRRNIRLT
jgi:DNA-3-methyladenine glycosylase II